MNQSNLVRVTVGLPVYNGARFLRQAIESILAQTFSHWELIISDNASTDATPGICRGYAERDRRVRYHRADTNRGSAWNHNRLFELSTGDYFHWIGADDILAADLLTSCAAILDANPSAIACCPTAVIIDEEGKVVDMPLERLPIDSVDTVVRFSSLLGPIAPRHNPFYALIRRTALGKTRLMGPFLSGDRCLVAELSLLGPFALSEARFFRRKYAGNLERSVTAEMNIYDPHSGGRLVVREWRVCREHIASIRRASLETRLKIRLLAAVLSWVISKRRVFHDELVAITVQFARRVIRPLAVHGSTSNTK